jgi:hypothetical protein
MLVPGFIGPEKPLISRLSLAVAISAELVMMLGLNKHWIA